MRVFLSRHGETTGDVEERYGGDYDDQLSPKGREESEELAGRLLGKGIQVIYHSPKLRAVETSQIVNSRLGARLVRVDDLRERNNYGILTGLTKTEAKARFPEEVGKLADGAYRHSVKGSEDYEDFRRRVVSAFEMVTKDDSFGTIGIVTHGGPIRCIVREVLKLGELRELGDCAVLEIERAGDRFTLVGMENASLEEK